MPKANGKKNLAAVMLGQLAALKMTPTERVDRARKAALARWGPSKKTPRRRPTRAKKSRPEPAQALPEANAG